VPSLNQAPVRILLVEDNPADIRLLREALKDGGVEHELDVVRDGVEALAYLRAKTGRENLPDLMLLDVNLPRMTGQTVLERLGTDANLARIPVILITVSRVEDAFLRAHGMDCTRCLAKPVDFRALAEAIRRATS